MTYPMDDNRAGAEFLSSYPMSAADRRKVGYENAALFRAGDRIFDPAG